VILGVHTKVRTVWAAAFPKVDLTVVVDYTRPPGRTTTTRSSTSAPSTGAPTGQGGQLRRPAAAVRARHQHPGAAVTGKQAAWARPLKRRLVSWAAAPTRARCSANGRSRSYGCSPRVTATGPSRPPLPQRGHAARAARTRRP